MSRIPAHLSSGSSPSTDLSGPISADTVGALPKSEFKKRKRAKIGPGINQLGSESESGLGSQGID